MTGIGLATRLPRKDRADAEAEGLSMARVLHGLWPRIVSPAIDPTQGKVPER